MKPTQVRYSVAGMALGINMLCYTDRVCIAVAAPRIREDFGFNQQQMGLILSIFSLAYAFGQAPWGAVADRFGSRGLISLAILAWSAFTALTAAAWSFTSLLAIRFIFGGLEAALSPATAAAFSRWVPVTERSTVFGAFLSGGRLGGALTPPIAAWLMLQFGWRWMFPIFGLLGVGAAAIWYGWFRDDPAKHSAVNAGELELIRRDAIPLLRTSDRQRVPWKEVLSSGRLWCLMGVAFAATFLWQFYITWFPTYLMENRGLPLKEASYYAGLPFLLGVGATWVGGLAADYLSRRLNVRTGRRIIGVVSLLGASSLMLVGVLAVNPRLGALLMASAAFFVDLYLGAAWASAVDIGKSNGGAVAGLMNASSNAAGFVSPALMGWALHTRNDWNLVLLIGVASTAFAAVLWLGVTRADEKRLTTN